MAGQRRKDRFGLQVDRLPIADLLPLPGRMRSDTGNPSLKRRSRAARNMTSGPLIRGVPVTGGAHHEKIDSAPATDSLTPSFVASPRPLI